VQLDGATWPCSLAVQPGRAAWPSSLMCKHIIHWQQPWRAAWPSSLLCKQIIHWQQPWPCSLDVQPVVQVDYSLAAALIVQPGRTAWPCSLAEQPERAAWPNSLLCKHIIYWQQPWRAAWPSSLLSKQIIHWQQLCLCSLDVQPAVQADYSLAAVLAVQPGRAACCQS
jgi:hypothetical protein